MKIIIFFLLLISLFSFPIKLYEYKYHNLTIYRSLGAPIEPFFEYDEIKILNWEPFPAELIEIRKGNPKILIIHGLSPWEIDEKMDYYKKSMIKTFKEVFPKSIGLYFFLYPTLSVDLEKSANDLIKLTKNFDSFYVYAHSMGGLLIRYALQNKSFQKKVKKIIFAGTPHIGSPLANFMVLKKDIFNKLSGHSISLVKHALIISNILKASVDAPNYKYLVFGVKHPDLPEEIKAVNFVGILDYNFKNEDLKKILNSKVSTFVGLMLLKYIIENIYPQNSIFQNNDGMVPVYSASKIADETIIFEATNHADLAMRHDIIEKAKEIFGLEGGNNEN
ncbi:MAG: esterase [Thermosipho sp. (in: Bacteria)]|nr:esterase [Thermosipho sp. (in: thermotogales)]